MNRRILTPILTSVVAGLIVAFATVGGSMAEDQVAAAKTDRLMRYVTVASTDQDAGVTTLTRVKAGNEAF